MQEEVEQRTLTLVINGTKFSGRVLKSAVSKFVAFCRNQKAKKVNVHPKGKQSVKQLTQQGQGVNTMEIDDANLRQFERIARKYGVDYAVRYSAFPRVFQRPRRRCDHGGAQGVFKRQRAQKRAPVASAKAARYCAGRGRAEGEKEGA